MVGRTNFCIEDICELLIANEEAEPNAETDAETADYESSDEEDE